MKYVFNHFYLIRHDKKRSIICSHLYQNETSDVNSDWLSYIHPIYAMILSFFCVPTEVEDAVKKISSFFGFSETYTNSLIVNFIENKEVFHTDYNGYHNNFPKNLIIKECDLKYNIRVYDPRMFKYSILDFKTFRLYSAPLYVTFMVNNKCLTDCVYCYADKTTKSKELEFSKVEDIIDEAYKLNLNSFNVDGGEFFMYRHWRELLNKLCSCEFKPQIVSTKYPISEKDIIDFSKYNIDLQVSLDSINQEVLNNMVGIIPNYANKMRQSLLSIDKYKTFQVATILTKYNGNIGELDTLYTFFCKLKNIKQWEIRVGFKSLYSKVNFDDIRIDEQNIQKIKHWIEERDKNSPFKIKWSPGREVDFFKSKNGSAEFKGGRCSANTIHLFILPDGKVTICEQLYWKKRYIIGDLNKNRIIDIWNSRSALALAHMKQVEYSNDSACHKCKIFDKCKSNMNSCYANILKVYGDKHWDYPDPRCSRAPKDISEKIYV